METGVITVSVIGSRPVIATRNGPADLPSRLLTDAVAQGLVRFDAAGQIEPGLAERWIVTEAGSSYIFRLREAQWADGTPVTAEQVAARLRQRLSPASGNPLAPFLTAIDEAVAMTPQVIEIRLKRPRPDLLKLFAQPDLAIVRSGSPALGSGPLRAVNDRGATHLRPATEADHPQEKTTPRGHPVVELRGERAAMAVARFASGHADLVTGGSFADWPLAIAASLPPTQVRIDPAVGLFGLAIVSRQGFLADVANRIAVAAAIDATAATAAIAADWRVDQRLLPAALDSAALPRIADWTTLPLEQRQLMARARVAAWPAPVALRIALPIGPGATRLWGQIAAALIRVGIKPVRVTQRAPAELRLVDAVAPYDSARWYLTTACQPCSPVPLRLIIAARDAPSMAQRALRLAQADAALTADTAFIPLARPLRWSLVKPGLQLWQTNARAWHPLNRLRTDPT